MILKFSFCLQDAQSAINDLTGMKMKQKKLRSQLEKISCELGMIVEFLAGNISNTVVLVPSYEKKE